MTSSSRKLRRSAGWLLLGGALALVGCGAPGDLPGDNSTSDQAVTSSGFEAESMSAVSGQPAPVVISDTAASAGKALAFWQKGGAHRTVSVPAAVTKLTVRARANVCQGSPQMELRVDNVLVLTSTVSATVWTDYSVAVSLPAGAHSFQINFPNDFSGGGCDRNLYADVLRWTLQNPAPPDSGTPPPPPPPPPPTDGGTPPPPPPPSSVGAGNAPVGTPCVNPRATVNAGMSTSAIQSAINAAGTGAYVCFEPGTYRLTSSLRPLASQTLHGSAGTVLKGSVVLSGATSSGGTYVFSNVPLVTTGPQSYAEPWCEDTTHFPCAYEEDVFFDGAPLTRVPSASSVTPGTFYTDYAAAQVHVGSNPSGHTVEIGHTAAAFNVDVSNTIVEGFVVEMFAHPMDYGAIEIGHAAVGVTVRNNEGRYNHGSGAVTGGANTTLRYNRFHDNGQAGAQAGLGSGVVVDHNDFLHNNIDGFWRIDGAAGGLKLDLEKGGTITNNLVANNNNHGLWFDDNSDNIVCTGNDVLDNFASGIQFEISSNAKFLNNRVLRNGLGDATSRGHIGCTSLACSAGIMISTSANVEAAGNVVDGNSNGITVQSTNRTPRNGQITIPLATGNQIHDNVVTLGSGAIGLKDSGPSGFNAYAPSSNNRFFHNTYHLSSLAAASFYWNNAPANASQWKADGQDTDGTFSSP